jgi:hypothetical protein
MNVLLPFEHDLEAVRDAGQVIGGDLIWAPETEQRIREAFSIANQWRDSHAQARSGSAEYGAGVGKDFYLRV